MSKIINLTPHTINIINDDNDEIMSFESMGIARADSSETVVDNINGIDIVHMSYGEPIGLPEYTDDTFYIVSMLTISAAKSIGRTTDDLLTTADLVRNDKGQIVGCKKLSRV